MLRFASVFAFLLLALLVLQAHATTTTNDEEKDDDEHERMLVERRAEFKSWSDIHEKTYESPDHEAERFQIWMENDEKIKKHNSQIPVSNYTMGHNAFSDMTQEEFAAHVGLMTNNKVVVDAESLHDVEMEANNDDIEEDHPGLRRKLAVPSTVDWRTKGVLTPVRNAGTCGCSYAIAAVGAIETFFAITTRKLTPLSVQQIVSCDTFDYGCAGGWTATALRYAFYAGLVTEAYYPYKGQDDSCKYHGEKVVSSPTFKLKNYDAIAPSQSSLQAALSNYPVAVTLDATQWQFYSSGIVTNCPKNINHSVLVVGYDYQGNWIIQNSWGTKWGEKGYIRIGGASCSVLYYAYQVVA